MQIYLAGPDVFRPDAMERAEAARLLCRQYGYEAIIPTDAEETDPDKICQANLAMIKRAQVVVANLDAFRGAEPDSGTCFELGFAVALGKKVCGYVSHFQTTVERVADLERRRIAGDSPEDKNGWHIENFGLPANLMLACSMTILEGDLEVVLKHLRPRATSAERVILDAVGQ